MKVKKAIQKPKCSKAATAPAKQRLAELKQSKVVAPKERTYINFDFFYKRTLFRSMTIFYKQEFKTYFE